jgi:hypothetical protein
MSNFTLLDTAFGMIFFYLLLSLICSALNELISAFLNGRAWFLYRGITRLLDDPAFTTMLYEHPLIRNLSDYTHPLLAKSGRKHLPAYIPAKNFALALMDLIEPGTGTRNALASAGAPAPIAVVNVNREQSTGAEVPNRSVPPTATGLITALKQENTPIPASVRRALICLIEAAGQDATKARQNIEAWYNSTMDRVAGAYKRRTQYVLFVIGAVATISLNADSIVVAKRLRTDKHLATIVASSAQDFLASSSAEVGASEQAQHSESTQIRHPKPATTEQTAKSLAETVDTLDKLGLPIAWDGPGFANTFPAPNAVFWHNCWALCRIHGIGWFLTVLAISFGAPFWFDVLNRFMLVRSTVKPKEKSPDEASKA